MRKQKISFPFCIQTIARSPSLVKTLDGDIRLSQLGIRIGSKCRHRYIQFQLPLNDAFTVTGKKDNITIDNEEERSMYFRVILILVHIETITAGRYYFNFLEKVSENIRYLKRYLHQ